MIHPKASAKMENLLDLNELCDSENISVTQLDFLPTQDLFKFDLPENKRFETVVSDEQLKKRKDDRIPKNTRKQNCWAVSCYQDWAKWRNTRAETLVGDSGSVPIDLSTQSLMTIDYWLSRFIIECRRRDGKPYPPATLYNIATSIQRELREEHGRADVNILDSRDVHFAEFRKQLDSRMKELTNEGVGIHKERADPVSEQDELQLWETEVIGHNSANALSYGVFFYNCKVFGFRRGDEHRNLDVSRYTLTTESGQTTSSTLPQTRTEPTTTIAKTTLSTKTTATTTSSRTMSTAPTIISSSNTSVRIEVTKATKVTLSSKKSSTYRTEGVSKAAFEITDDKYKYHIVMYVSIPATVAIVGIFAVIIIVVYRVTRKKHQPIHGANTSRKEIDTEDNLPRDDESVHIYEQCACSEDVAYQSNGMYLTPVTSTVVNPHEDEASVNKGKEKSCQNNRKPPNRVNNAVYTSTSTGAVRPEDSYEKLVKDDTTDKHVYHTAYY